MSDEKEIAVEVHPLSKQHIRPTYNWCEWLAKWEASGEDYFWKESLLHNGFSVSVQYLHYEEKRYDDIDRLLFYFSVAEGWTDSSNFYNPLNHRDTARYFIGCNSDGKCIEKTEVELCQGLALKAFDMLCLNFFKAELEFDGRRGRVFCDIWAETVVSERLFPVLQNFFRIEKEYPHSPDCNDTILCNLYRYDSRRSHNEQLAVGFLLNLAKFLWGWKEPTDGHYYGEDARKLREEAEKKIAALRARIDAAKPWMVEVLEKLGKLSVLREWILELDKACLAKLKEIAMRTQMIKHQASKNRPVASLEEACYSGSKAAWFLRDYELLVREHKRLTAILEAEHKREAAERELAKLTGKK